MAIIGNTAFLLDVSIPILVNGLPIGNPVNDPFTLDVVPDGVVPPILGNRFPTPPAGKGFLMTPIEAVYIAPSGATGPTLTGALVPEGSFLEPTQGQIWPRIG